MDAADPVPITPTPDMSIPHGHAGHNGEGKRARGRDAAANDNASNIHDPDISVAAPPAKRVCVSRHTAPTHTVDGVDSPATRAHPSASYGSCTRNDAGVGIDAPSFLCEADCNGETLSPTCAVQDPTFFQAYGELSMHDASYGPCFGTATATTTACAVPSATTTMTAAATAVPSATTVPSAATTVADAATPVATTNAAATTTANATITTAARAVPSSTITTIVDLSGEFCEDEAFQGSGDNTDRGQAVCSGATCRNGSRADSHHIDEIIRLLGDHGKKARSNKYLDADEFIESAASAYGALSASEKISVEVNSAISGAFVHLKPEDKIDFAVALVEELCNSSAHKTKASLGWLRQVVATAVKELQSEFPDVANPSGIEAVADGYDGAVGDAVQTGISSALRHMAKYANKAKHRAGGNVWQFKFAPPKDMDDEEKRANALRMHKCKSAIQLLICVVTAARAKQDCGDADEDEDGDDDDDDDDDVDDDDDDDDDDKHASVDEDVCRSVIGVLDELDARLVVFRWALQMYRTETKRTGDDKVELISDERAHDHANEIICSAFEGGFVLDVGISEESVIDAETSRLGLDAAGDGECGHSVEGHGAGGGGDSGGGGSSGAGRGGGGSGSAGGGGGFDDKAAQHHVSKIRALRWIGQLVYFVYKHSHGNLCWNRAEKHSKCLMEY